MMGQRRERVGGWAREEYGQGDDPKKGTKRMIGQRKERTG